MGYDPSHFTHPSIIPAITQESSQIPSRDSILTKQYMCYVDIFAIVSREAAVLLDFVQNILDQLSAQITCLKRWIVPIAVFQVFSRVMFQMSAKIICLKRGIVAKIARFLTKMINKCQPKCIASNNSKSKWFQQNVYIWSLQMSPPSFGSLNAYDLTQSLKD